MSSVDYNIPVKSAMKPSIFEVLAVENLSSGLRNAFEYLLKVLSENHPDRYELVYRYCNEFYGLINLTIQHYCLRTHNASFAENFYGLKRVPTGDSGRLNKHHVYRSLLLIVGMPYLKNLLHRLYKKEKDSLETGNQPNNELLDVATRLRILFIQVYPYVHLIAQTVNVLYQLLYATGKSLHPSLEHHLSATELHSLTKEDIVNTDSDLIEQKLSEQLKSLPETLLHVIASGLSAGVSVGAFFLQFLDWWYNREGVPLSFQPLPIPPPPSKYPTEVAEGSCPLCLQKIRSETLLTISGFVFCFRCIYSHLKNSQICPVTRIPATTEHLVRLYIPSE